MFSINAPTLNNNEVRKIIDLHQHCSIDAPWSDPILYRKIIDSLIQPFAGLHVTKVLAIESGGNHLASAIAYKLHTGLVIVHKPGFF